MICAFKRRDMKTPKERWGRGSHVTTEAKVGVTWPRARGFLEPPKARRGRNDPPLEPLKGAWSCDTFWPQSPEKILSWCFKLSDCATLLQ